MSDPVQARPGRFRRIGWAAVGVAALVALSGGPASAHTELVESDPVDGASLDRVPVEAQLVFSDAIAGDFVTVVVTPGVGAAPQPAPATVDGTGVTVDLSQVPAAPPVGQQPWTWQLSYRVVSEDGHPIEGDITFSVSVVDDAPSRATADPPTPTATTAAASQPSPSTARADGAWTPPAAVDTAASDAPSGDLVWAYLLAGSVVLAVSVLVTVALARWRRGSSSP